MNATVPEVAMVLAAGLGKRMRPITDTMPKPLVPIAGKPLLDWGLDALGAAGVARAVVNLHHFPDQIRRHLAGRRAPAIQLSDESDGLLDSAGGIVRALPLLGPEPFLVLNADTFWLEEGGMEHDCAGHAGNAPNLVALAGAWDDDRMDILLMVADPARATGHSGGTDFAMDAEGRLARHRGTAGVIYAGAAIVHPRIFAGAEPMPHSLNRYFDACIATGRLFGHAMRGQWITVGTPEAIPLAEAVVARAFAGAP